MRHEQVGYHSEHKALTVHYTTMMSQLAYTSVVVGMGEKTKWLELFSVSCYQEFAIFTSGNIPHSHKGMDMHGYSYHKLISNQEGKLLITARTSLLAHVFLHTLFLTEDH